MPCLEQTVARRSQVEILPPLLRKALETGLFHVSTGGFRGRGSADSLNVPWWAPHEAAPHHERCRGELAGVDEDVGYAVGVAGDELGRAGLEGDEHHRSPRAGEGR